MTRAVNTHTAAMRADAEMYIRMPLDELLERADAERKKVWGNRVWFCSIVNAQSGKCSEDCAFCAQSAHYSTNCEQYEMMSADDLADALISTAHPSVSNVSVVTTGRYAPNGTQRKAVCDALRTTADACNAQRCVSIGICDDACLDELKNAGVTRIHHNLETSRRFFPQICTTHTYDERRNMILRALSHGFEICAGGIIGLGENWNDRIDLACDLIELGVHSIPLNFLTPIPGTPLAGLPPLAPEEALRCIALFRCLAPHTEIRIAGGREFCLKSMQKDIFKAGATGIMTGNYLTTDGHTVDDDMLLVHSCGMDIVQAHTNTENLLFDKKPIENI